jgi:hypothetical protein
LLFVFVFTGVGVGGCAPNFIVRHRSEVQRPIEIYLNWKLFCTVSPGQECSARLEPGRYYFYAIVPGLLEPRWASRQKPAVFTIDRRTVIDLHNLLKRIPQDVTPSKS